MEQPNKRSLIQVKHILEPTSSAKHGLTHQLAPSLNQVAIESQLTREGLRTNQPTNYQTNLP